MGLPERPSIVEPDSVLDRFNYRDGTIEQPKRCTVSGFMHLIPMIGHTVDIAWAMTDDARTDGWMLVTAGRTATELGYPPHVWLKLGSVTLDLFETSAQLYVADRNNTARAVRFVADEDSEIRLGTHGGVMTPTLIVTGVGL